MRRSDRPGSTTGVLRDLARLLRRLNTRRRLQLSALLALQILSALFEVIGLGAVLPFLGALANADKLLEDSRLRPVLDWLQVSSPEALIITSACVFGLAILAVNLVRVVTLWVQTRLAGAIGSDLSVEVYRRLLHQPYEFHADANSGNLISTMVNDLNATLSVLLNFLMIVTQSLVAIAIVVALLAFDPQIAISVTVITCLLYLFISRITRAQLIRSGRIVSDGNTELVRTVQEGLGGIRDIILDHSQEPYISRYGRADRAMRQASASIQLLRMVPRYFIEAVGIVVLSALTVILAMNESDFRNLLPVVGGLAMAANRLLPAAQQVYASYAGIQGSHVSMRRTLAALERVCDPARSTRSISPLVPTDRILVRNAWFRYGARSPDPASSDWVLRGVTLTIPVNQTVALVGKTGGGKTTLADILLGLLSPERGDVLIDAVPLGDNLASWGEAVAHVPQSIYLSDASIKENIAFGIPVAEIDMERVRAAAEMARIREFIEARPNGYDERVGERGIRLSGGQRQRIGIARALYKRASVIVFDEATSALDNATEKFVMEAIANLGGKVTIVLIAHRLSTIQAADLIYEIQNGEVVAAGRYDELLERSESFRDMVEAARTNKADVI